MTIPPLLTNVNMANLPKNTTYTWVEPVPYSTEDIDKFSRDLKNQKKKKYAYTAAGTTAGLVLLAVALLKRKSISKFFKNIFKKGGSGSSSASGRTTQQVKPKIELPKPNFTVGEENPELFAKEKAEYIKSIWDEFLDVFPPVKPMNKDKSILGLKALQKFGTRDDLLKLSPEYELSKDSDIMKEYAKFVNKVGESIDCLPIMSKLGIEDISYTEETLAEMMKTLKTLMVDRTKPNAWKNFEYTKYVQFERLSTHKNKDISENAKAIMKRLSDENPWMLE